LIVSTQDTFREIFDQAPVGIAQVSFEGKFLEVNRRFCQMTGYSRDELLATDFQHVTSRDDLRADLKALAGFASGDLETYSNEERYVRKDGLTIWARVSVSLRRDADSGKPLHCITVVEEISVYKRAEELRRKAEEMFAVAFRQMPIATAIISLKDGRFVDVNESFERFTGYSRQDAVGSASTHLNLFIESSVPNEILDTVITGGRVRGWERRIRNKDGKIGWALFSADRIETDGEPCLIWAALDITDRKRLESELREMGGRLLNAQDEERKRIAGELNDGLGQSITAISYEACQLARKTPGQLGLSLQSICAKAQDVAARIAILSQNLHPSGLDYTSLPWAIQGLCRQFTDSDGLHVAFSHQGVPPSLSHEIGVGLYRIVQEGLKNIVEHSGTREAWIELRSDGSEIHLALWDKGRGFNPSSTRAGLGLLTIQERCRRLNGSLAIRNHHGTRIEAQIPLPGPEPYLFDSLTGIEPENRNIL
jgi:PAS domain S-box-containing protein